MYLYLELPVSVPGLYLYLEPVPGVSVPGTTADVFVPGQYLYLEPGVSVPGTRCICT